MRDFCWSFFFAHAMRSYNNRYGVRDLFNEVIPEAQQVQVHAVIRIFDAEI
jgi:hypothetical protein